VIHFGVSEILIIVKFWHVCRYRELALRYHPDKCREPGAETMFKRVSEAYEILRNPQTRSEYDSFLLSRTRRQQPASQSSQQQQQPYRQQYASGSNSSMNSNQFGFQGYGSTSAPGGTRFAAPQFHRTAAEIFEEFFRNDPFRDDFFGTHPPLNLFTSTFI
jgi:DnaJ-class molecular chaperone